MSRETQIRRIKRARFALPNLVTLGSVFCSFLSMFSVIQAMELAGDARIDRLQTAALFILGSIVFDTFDGKVARWTKTSTKFGMELDSLADGVSFGIAPAVLMYGFALRDAGWFGIIACFLFACGALLRLARFNIEAPDEGVQTLFKGIPSPAGAATLAATVLACIDLDMTSFSPFGLKSIGVLIVAVGLLMVSNVRYKTLKGKKTHADWVWVIGGILFFAGMTYYFHSFAIGFFLLVCYFILWGILLSVYINLTRVPRVPRRRRRRRSADESGASLDAVATETPTSTDTSTSTETPTSAEPADRT